MKKISMLVMIAILASTLLATSSIPALAEDVEFSTVQDNSDISQTITEKGIALSVEDFNKAMTGPESERQPKESCSSYKTVDLQIKNLNLNGSTISFDANAKYSGEKSDISASGSLYAGFKAQNGMNSIVGNLEDLTGNFKILLFEIFNDSSKDNLLVKNEINEKPHLKMYLLDSNKDILFFEIELPKVLEQLNANAFSEGDSKNDLYWFTELAKPTEIKNISTDKEIMQKLGIPTTKKRALGGYSTWANPTTYYKAFYVGNDYTQCYSLPYLEYKHVNVASQDSTWTAAFKVAEHTQVGNYTYYGNNVFSYRNLQINFGCGDKSTFVRTFQEGRMYDYTSYIKGIKSLYDTITASLGKKVVSTLPYGSTLNTILGYFNTLTSQSGEVTLGGGAVSLSDRKTVAVGQKLAKYEFEECTDHGGQILNGDYYIYQALLQYESTSGTSVSTVGALQLKFDVYDKSVPSTTSVSQNFQLNYTAIP
ncbi:hypothetical protein EHE19_016875 [Ruminiclostridium herbifermentans]|uniref:Uncharacterized protein n=1 Tax=Ruminiclostridium herbifermentans TaxID=2488810 RepID=A0A4U7J7Z6_9FIRM|nr:hypothetical protein [Ruminiclostridium herbifermentans]QNU66511.1 hypothetical protein EHE19_016875 [Ruminiclostridium herbifermentans]